jgi:hypothetical protein
MSPSGMLTLSGVLVANNTVGEFGGGVCLGVGDGSTASPTCGLQLLAGTVLSGNSAAHGGAQVYSDCSGDVLVQDTYMGLTADVSQVRG